MIVGPLKKGLQSALTVIIVFFIIFIVLALFSVTGYSSNDSKSVVYSLIHQSVQSPIAILFTNILCITLGCVLISAYTIRHEIADKQNFIPAFLYLFFSGLTFSKELLHPSLLANIFILISLYLLTDTYREDNSISKLFNAALFCCLSVFFCINYSIFILLFFIALLILRAFNWREWAVSILGFASPLFIYSCLGYLMNFDFLSFLNNIIGVNTELQKPLMSEYFYPVLAAIFILLLAGIIKHLGGGLGSKIKTQKSLGIIYWFLVLSFVNFFSRNNNHYFPLIASIIPVSVLFGDYFFNIRQLKISNTLFFFLLASGSLLFLMHLGVI